MKALLLLFLAYYYADGKRSTPGRITRKLDADVRAFTKGRPELKELIAAGKKIADAAKARRRRTSGKPPKKMQLRGVQGVVHVPCHRKKS
jgi:hypothetical protein